MGPPLAASREAVDPWGGGVTEPPVSVAPAGQIGMEILCACRSARWRFPARTVDFPPDRHGDAEDAWISTS